MKIEDFASDVACQMGVELLKVSLIDGQRLGCIDSYILDMTTKNETVGTLIYKRDIDKLDDEDECARLEIRIRTALLRLTAMMKTDCELALDFAPCRGRRLADRQHRFTN